MTEIQLIERDGHREFAVVPIEIWERVKHVIENMEDAALFDRQRQTTTGSACQRSVLDAELAGDHPVKAWREYRRLTQADLAAHQAAA